MRRQGSKRKAAKKAGARAGYRSAPLHTVYFRTEDPDVFMAYDFNPATGAYDLNCRLVPREEVPKEFQSNEFLRRPSGTLRTRSGGRPSRKMKGAKKSTPKKAAKKSTPKKAAKKAAAKTPKKAAKKAAKTSAKAGAKKRAPKKQAPAYEAPMPEREDRMRRELTGAAADKEQRGAERVGSKPSDKKTKTKTKTTKTKTSVAGALQVWEDDPGTGVVTRVWEDDTGTSFTEQQMLQIEAVPAQNSD